jgi:hypothetical protein
MDKKTSSPARAGLVWRVLLAGAVTASLPACAARATPAQAPATAPDASHPSATVETIVNAPAEEVFAFVVAEDTPRRVLKPYGLIPAVKGSVILDGPWDHPGANRTVVLDGGQTLHEEITAYDSPRFFSYEISDFSFSLKTIASKGRGTWSFVDMGDRTKVTWTYSFEPSSCPVRPALGFFVSTFYHPFMERGMAAIKLEVEEKHPASALAQLVTGLRIGD